MALFSFLRNQKPVPFTYHPRFYDERKEAFQERLKKAQDLAGDDPEALKRRIRSSLQKRSGYLPERSYRSRQTTRSNIMVMAILLILIAITFLYLPRIMQYLE